MKIEKLICDTHITGLNYYENRLYVGCGQELEIYCLKRNQKLAKHHVFDEFTIYGIEMYEDKNRLFLIVYGNRFFKIYQLIESTQSSIELKLWLNKINLNDWILDVQFRKNKIYCSLTSNRLGIFDLNKNELNTIDCPQKFTLYCSKFLNDFNEDETITTIASGTVFAEILICNYTFSDCTIIDRLQGHEGSIFSIDFNKKLNLLVSSSNDRTIRLWKLDETNHFNCIRVLYGHESRIWQVKIANDCIISVGKI